MIVTKLKPIIAKVGEVALAGVAYLFYGLLRLIGLRASRSFLGAVTGTIGPRISKSQRAIRNLKRILPHLSDVERQLIVRQMWKNLAYVVAEYGHLEKIKIFDNPSIRVEGIHHLQSLKEDGKPGLIFTGHLGNWELVSLLCAQFDVPIAQVYRGANNPYINNLVRRLQEAGTSHLIPKGPEGGRKSIEALKAGQHLILLIDQKMNNGISVPLMGHEAMTAPGLARLAERFQCPVLPVQVEREGVDRFVITCHPPLFFIASEDAERYRTFMTQVHTLLESWILKHPEQWLWLHNRWPW